MLHEATLGQLGIFGAGTAVVGVGIDGDAATGREETDDLDVFGFHQADKVFHDDVDTVLMEITVVAKGEEVEFGRSRGQVIDLLFWLKILPYFTPIRDK